MIFTVFPIPLQGTYWYVTQYISLLLLTPFLNKLIQMLTEKQHKLALIFCLLLFSGLPAVSFLNNVFSSGTDVVWFCTLYLLASYLARYNKSLAKNAFPLLLLGGVCFTSAGYLVASTLSRQMTGRADSFGTVVFSYNFPTVVATSIGLFGLFYQIRIKSNWLKRRISKIGTHTFGVYLWHNHFLFREIIWERLNPVGMIDKGLCIMIFRCIFTVIGLFLTGIIIDIMRSYLGKAIDMLIDSRRKDRFCTIDKRINSLFIPPSAGTFNKRGIL